jgi:predicted metalloprotease with PDZ domain
MWRGGLSAPASLYIHASRPLLSENGTSTLMHEIVHIGMAASAEKGADWIVEGMAEYYGLQLLLRSGTITQNRYARALSQLSEWGADQELGCNGSANGAVSARAALLMHELDRELRKKTKNEYNLDDVMNVLARQEQRISIADLENAVNQLLGQESAVLNEAAPGNCSN